MAGQTTAILLDLYIGFRQGEYHRIPLCERLRKLITILHSDPSHARTLPKGLIAPLPS